MDPLSEVLSLLKLQTYVINASMINARSLDVDNRRRRRALTVSFACIIRLSGSTAAVCLVQPHFLHLTTQAWGSAGRTPVIAQQS